jgi:hypothetical protein
MSKARVGKKDQLEDPESTLNKVADDEPIFVLRASDKFAALLVCMWGELAKMHGCPADKLMSARLVLTEMRDWKRKKFPD